MDGINHSIPDGWRKIPIDECVVEKKKSPIKVDDATNYGQYPFFTSGESILQHVDKLIDGENIYLATGGMANVKYYNGEAAYSTDTYVLGAKENYCPKYIYYVLLYLRQYIDINFFQGSGLKHLQKKDFKRHEIVVPKSKDEQQRIADALTRIDNAMERTQQLIDKYELVRCGLMQDLLTYGIDKNGIIRNEKTHKFKDSPIGRIPEEWECVELSKAFDEIEDCPHTTPEYLSHGVLVARTFCIKDGEYLIEESSYVSEKEYYERISRLEPKPGDIIFTREAPIGEAFVIPKGMKICLGQRVMILRPKKKLYPEYFVYQNYGDRMQSYYRGIVGGTTVNHLNVKDVKELWLSIPLDNEQQQIIFDITKSVNFVRALKNELSSLSNIKQGLLADLVTGKVRI